MRKHHAILTALIIMLLASCSRAEPAQDQAALEATVSQRIFATLTASAPTATPVPQSTDTPTPSPPTATPVPPTDTATAAPTRVEASPTPTDTPAPSETPTPTGPKALVKGQVMNVRAGPGTAFSVVASAKQGETLEVTARNEDQKWLEVRLPDGKTGWVSSSLVELNVPGGQIALAEVIPTPPPSPTPALASPTSSLTTQAKQTGKDLEVTFVNPNYDCQQGDWGGDPPYWGYRSFQVDMYIKNNSQQPIEPPWEPKHWIITDGANDFVNDMMWQWVSRSTGFYDQPTIQPGQSAGWTFLAFPVDRNQWVKAVEYVWNGQVYRQDFDLGTYGNAYNYKDCGEPRPHKDYPTPTPEP